MHCWHNALSNKLSKWQIIATVYSHNSVLIGGFKYSPGSRRAAYSTVFRYQGLRLHTWTCVRKTLTFSRAVVYCFALYILFFFVYVLANLSLIRGLYEHRMFVRCALQRACAQGAHAVQVSQRSAASWFNKASRPFSLYSPRVSANLPSLALHGLVAWE